MPRTRSGALLNAILLSILLTAMSPIKAHSAVLCSQIFSSNSDDQWKGPTTSEKAKAFAEKVIGKRIGSLPERQRQMQTQFVVALLLSKMSLPTDDYAVRNHGETLSIRLQKVSQILNSEEGQLRIADLDYSSFFGSQEYLRQVLKIADELDLKDSKSTIVFEKGKGEAPVSRLNSDQYKQWADGTLLAKASEFQNSIHRKLGSPLAKLFFGENGQSMSVAIDAFFETASPYYLQRIGAYYLAHQMKVGFKDISLSESLQIFAKSLGPAAIKLFQLVSGEKVDLFKNGNSPANQLEMKDTLDRIVQDSWQNVRFEIDNLNPVSVGSMAQVYFGRMINKKTGTVADVAIRASKPHETLVDMLREEDKFLAAFADRLQKRLSDIGDSRQYAAQAESAKRGASSELDTREVAKLQQKAYSDFNGVRIGSANGRRFQLEVPAIHLVTENAIVMDRVRSTSMIEVQDKSLKLNALIASIDLLMTNLMQFGAPEVIDVSATEKTVRWIVNIEKQTARPEYDVKRHRPVYNKAVSLFGFDLMPPFTLPSNGYVHGDLHLGNMMLRPANGIKGVDYILTWLDFGLGQTFGRDKAGVTEVVAIVRAARGIRDSSEENHMKEALGALINPEFDLDRKLSHLRLPNQTENWTMFQWFDWIEAQGFSLRSDIKFFNRTAHLLNSELKKASGGKISMGDVLRSYADFIYHIGSVHSDFPSENLVYKDKDGAQLGFFERQQFLSRLKANESGNLSLTREAVSPLWSKYSTKEKHKPIEQEPFSEKVSKSVSELGQMMQRTWRQVKGYDQHKTEELRVKLEETAPEFSGYHFEKIKELIENGADPNVLMYEDKRKHPYMNTTTILNSLLSNLVGEELAIDKIRWLVENGARPDIKTVVYYRGGYSSILNRERESGFFEKNAFEIAEDRNLSETLKILRKLRSP